MCRLLYLLNKGEVFTETESTEIFFRACKLYQTQHPQIRKMLYYLLKEIRPKDTEVFMITSSLSRDLSSSENPYFKASSLRVMARILDPSMLIQMERYIKVAIVDSNDVVSSAALYVSLKLCKTHAEVVKKWLTEVQEKLSSKCSMIHFHAILLLYQMKKNDCLALSKFFDSMMNLNLNSPLAQTQLIRFIRVTLKSVRFESSTMGNIEKFLVGCLRLTQDMVVYEAAKTICEHSEHMQDDSLRAALSALQAFLVSTKISTKFAGIKALNTYAIKHAKLLTQSLSDYEALLSNPNRSLATLAISTMLKLSTDSNVEKLLGQITNFMNEVSDEFKTDLIESLKVLCLRMPHKHLLLVKFVGGVLKGEGGLHLKVKIVDTLQQIFEGLEVSRISVLIALAEFIEDCVYENLQSRVIYFLGEHGPSSAEPQRFIRYIYNRLILEKPAIRAVSISALFKFGEVAELHSSITSLLEKSLDDQDDEIRERAYFYISELSRHNFTRPVLPISIAKMEKILASCKSSGKCFAYDMAGQVEVQEEVKTSVALPETLVISRFSNIAELEELGVPSQVTASISLTEKNAEYVVNYVTHYFDECLVLEFRIDNTLPDVSLSEVSVNLHLDGSALEPLSRVNGGVLMYPAPKIDKNGSGVTYVVLKKLSGARKASVPAVMKSKVSDYQGDTVVAVFDDEYQIENINIELV